MTDRELNEKVWQSLGHNTPMPHNFNPIMDSGLCIEIICDLGMSFGNDGKTSPSEFRRKVCLALVERAQSGQ